MTRSSLILALCATCAYAFPWMKDIPGLNLAPVQAEAQRTALSRRQAIVDKGGPDFCPLSPGITGAAPFNPLFPYTGAAFGLPGTGRGGVQVPAPGDTAHEFREPGPLDIRGPCPGMNTAANHGFLSRDGITNLAELLDAQQNLFNLEYGLALIIALRGIALDGDIVTTRISIGCDATAKTSIDPSGILGRQPGLDGHNRFEGDTSLTRDDFFFFGDDFTFNGTLFQNMYEFAQEFGGGLFNRETIAAYRGKRWDDSLATNANFYFGPKALLLYGAASFIYNAFPGSTAQPDIENTKTFYGAVDNGDGTWGKIAERIPEGWRNRENAYTLGEIGEEVYAQYTAYPKLFGGNVGTNNFLALNGTFGLITDGQIPSEATAADFTCFLYQVLTENVPGQVENEPDLALDVIEFLVSGIRPVFEDFGCPLDPNPQKRK